MLLYQVDHRRRWTGQTMEADDLAPMPAGWIAAEPPAVPSGEVAVWGGANWLLADAVQEARADQLGCLAGIVGSKLGGTVLHNGHVYQLGPDRYGTQAVFNIMSKALEADLVLSGRLPGPWPVDFAWIDATNARVPLDAEGMIGLGARASSYVTAVRMQGDAFRSAILTAETIEAVQAIDLTAGWPS